MASNPDKFNSAITKSRIPILILDNKWHRLFGKVNPTPEITDYEKELTELIKRQGKLHNEMKDLKKIKNNLMDEIVANMEGCDSANNDAVTDKKLNDNKRLINDANEKLEANEQELMELPRLIDEVNKKLMLATMEICYERLQSNTEQIEEIAEWIKEIRVTLKERVVKKQDMELYNAELYSYMHDIFGPDVMEIFDMKYVPTMHKIPDLKGNANIKADTDSEGNKLVE